MTTKTDEQERAEFERWHLLRYMFEAVWHPDGGVYLSHAQGRWEAYQAGRAALQSQKPKANDLMLSAILRMPFEMAMADPISRMQFYQRAQQALNELEALQSQDLDDAERYRYLRDSAQLFSHFGDIGNSGWCVMRRDHTIRRVFTYNGPELDEAIDHARRVEGEGK